MLPKTLLLLSLSLLLTACEDLTVKDSGDTGSWSGCCRIGCSDGSASTVVADSAWECDDIGATQCEANGLELDYADFEECRR